MLERPRFIWFRNYFFPFTGEEEITTTQQQRYILRWSLFFGGLFTLSIAPVLIMLKEVSAQVFFLTLLVTFIAIAILFGLMAWFVMLMLNRSVRIRQQWKTMPRCLDKQL